MQTPLFEVKTERGMDGLFPRPHVGPHKRQLLKWIGNKQRFAHEIISFLPNRYKSYYEPFLGSGAVLGVLQPHSGMGSDAFRPLIEIWTALRSDPEDLKRWYAERWEQAERGDRSEEYERVKASYNASNNGADLLYLCRSCYGGVVRFRKSDGYMSTPCGIHLPIEPAEFSRRVDDWSRRVQGAEFENLPYQEAMARAGLGDVVYCDPPYSFSQSILYGAQGFSLQELFGEIERAKARGAFVALSIDGSKKSGDVNCKLDIPKGLFAREVAVNCGRSMLRRFQMQGLSLESEVVSDRLLLTA